MATPPRDPDSPASPTPSPDPRDKALRTLTHVIYGLQAATAVNGITLVLAVILNYVKRGDTEGTLYESHFRWQIRTFWVVALVFLALFLVVLAVFFSVTDDRTRMAAVLVAGLGVTVLVIYLYYRVIKGWLALLEERQVG